VDSPILYEMTYNLRVRTMEQTTGRQRQLLLFNLCTVGCILHNQIACINLKEIKIVKDSVRNIVSLGYDCNFGDCVIT
jgi:hypothetical protein